VRPGDYRKYESLRCRRKGAFLALFRKRYRSHELPDDDSGRGDLWLLVRNESLAAAEPEKKMRHVVNLWAPWMPAEERDAYVKHVWGLDRYQRIMTGREIGEQLNLTCAEREELKLWPFKPADKTDEELAELTKARRNQRRRERSGSRSRATYLAELKSKPKPWVTQGISRAAYYRKRKREVPSQVGRGSVLSIVSKQVPNLVSLREESQRRGIQGVDVAESQQKIVTEAERMETKESGSTELGRDPVSPENDDPKIAALKNWGVAAEQVTST
jgi:hypothetical protein